jgi:hypothetical protein
MKQEAKLSQWAKIEGVSRMTAWRMAKAGTIPGAVLSPAGLWNVEVDRPDEVRQTVAYVRVSSPDQKADLDRQVARIAEWATRSRVKIDRYVREIGSALNDRRRELAGLLEDPMVEKIVVEHRERLARFGVSQPGVFDPAFTSVIGRVKYARGRAMSARHAAALVIGREAFASCRGRRKSFAPCGRGESSEAGTADKPCLHHGRDGDGADRHGWTENPRRFAPSRGRRCPGAETVGFG